MRVVVGISYDLSGPPGTPLLHSSQERAAAAGGGGRVSPTLQSGKQSWSPQEFPAMAQS